VTVPRLALRLLLDRRRLIRCLDCFSLHRPIVRPGAASASSIRDDAPPAAAGDARTIARKTGNEDGRNGHAAGATPRLVPARAVDRALAGPLVEQVARSIVEQRVVERALAEAWNDEQLRARVKAALEDREAIDRLVRQVVESPQLERAVQEIVDSRMVNEVVDRVVRSPALRAVVTQQSASLARDTVTTVRHRGERLDDRFEQRVHQRAAPAAREYGGLVTRALGLAVDVAAVYLLFLTGAAVFGLVASLAGGELHPAWLVAVVVGSAWAVVSSCYFGLFWSTTGQTPGMRLMRLRVATASGDPPGLLRSLVRLVGLVLATIPLFAGFLPVLFDARRRGLHDYLAQTVVLRVDEQPDP
jgi:uncharacterized RDD family membrane protein YckC